MYGVILIVASISLVIGGLIAALLFQIRTNKRLEDEHAKFANDVDDWMKFFKKLAETQQNAISTLSEEIKTVTKDRDDLQACLSLCLDELVNLEEVVS